MTTPALPSPAPGKRRSARALRHAGGGRYVLQGEVTLTTVAGLRSAGLRLFARGRGAIEVDLSGVGRADSGALALLVDWLAWARPAHRVLKFSSPPAALMALARLSDVEDLLLGKDR